MNKIVILSRGSHTDKVLLASLGLVFPDCKIHIIYKEPGTVIQPSVSHVGSKKQFEQGKHDDT